jgi:hypothetical protein
MLALCAYHAGESRGFHSIKTAIDRRYCERKRDIANLVVVAKAVMLISLATESVVSRINVNGSREQTSSLCCVNQSENVIENVVAAVAWQELEGLHI